MEQKCILSIYMSDVLFETENVFAHGTVEKIVFYWCFIWL